MNPCRIQNGDALVKLTPDILSLRRFLPDVRDCWGDAAGFTTSEVRLLRVLRTLYGSPCSRITDQLPQPFHACWLQASVVTELF